MREAIIFVFWAVFIVVAGVWFLTLAARIGMSTEECAKGNVFMLEGQFYQCVKVKAEVIK